MQDTSPMQLFWFESNCKIIGYVTEGLELIYTIRNVSVDVVIFASFVVGTGLNLS
jgi:AmiR/NasT family two-component response regulator